MADMDIRQLEYLFSGNYREGVTVPGGVTGVRTKQVRHGENLDVMIYPMWSRSIQRDIHRLKRGITSETQAKLNMRNATRKLIWLADTNFGVDDGMLSCSSFAVENDDPEIARKIVLSYIRKLRRIWKKNGRELKYIYTIESTKSAVNGVRFHLHIILNMHGFDRDTLESTWRISNCNTRIYRDNDNGYAGFAGYMNIYKSKQEKPFTRRWNSSHNLIQPEISVSDHVATPSEIVELADSLEQDGRRIMSEICPGYRVIEDIQIRTSDFVPGVYITVYMHRDRKRIAERGSQLWSAT